MIVVNLNEHYFCFVVVTGLAVVASPLASLGCRLILSRVWCDFLIDKYNTTYCSSIDKYFITLYTYSILVRPPCHVLCYPDALR